MRNNNILALTAGLVACLSVIACNSEKSAQTTAEPGAPAAAAVAQAGPEAAVAGAHAAPAVTEAKVDLVVSGMT
jgi:hypothetical protein